MLKQNMTSQDTIKSEAIELINQTFGEETAVLYTKIWETRSIEDALTALREILSDYVGERKAHQISDELYSKYQQ